VARLLYLRLRPAQWLLGGQTFAWESNGGMRFGASASPGGAPAASPDSGHDVADDALLDPALVARTEYSFVSVVHRWRGRNR